MLKTKNFGRKSLNEIKGNSRAVGPVAGMKIDESGNAVPGPTSIPPATALAANYGAFDEEDEPLDSLISGYPPRPRTFKGGEPGVSQRSVGRKAISYLPTEPTVRCSLEARRKSFTMRHRNASSNSDVTRKPPSRSAAQPGHVCPRRRPRRRPPWPWREEFSVCRGKDDHPGQEGRSALAPPGA